MPIVVVRIFSWVGIWFHFEDKVATMSESLLSAESRAVVVKRGVVALMPSLRVKGVEVIFPVEVVAVGLKVVSVGFDVVVDAVPWHLNWAETVAPGVESWGPEVHHEGL